MPGRAIEDAESEILDLKGLVEQLRSENDDLKGLVEQLRKEMADLKAELKALKDAQSQNSKNSHKPPSSEKPGQQRGKKGKTNRKRGGQIGHKGKQRALVPPEQVAHFEDVFPKNCEACEQELPQTFDPEHQRHQVTEIPPVVAEVTEYRLHAVTCPSCKIETKARLDGAISGSAFGPLLSTLVAMLVGVYHLSRRNTQKLILDLLGVQMSLGALSNIEDRVSRSLESASNEAMKEVLLAKIKHTDGTGWRQAGDSLQLWTIASKAATAFRVLKDGTRASIQAMFAVITGFLVSDRATALLFWDMSKRQICWAHLLRKIIFFSERDDDRGKHGRALLEYAALVFRYWHQFKDGELDRTTLLSRMQPVREQFEDLLKKAVASGLAGLSGSCKDILDHQAALWTYLTEEGVEPTNNHGEQVLRGFVIWRKLCFGSQSERGNRFAERVMTVAYTARKQNVGLLSFMVDSYRSYLHGLPAPPLLAEKPTTVEVAS